ncbi:C4-dicarboxylate transporter DcuC [Oleispirillum naphthae]|uniref:C4-dicarboxylate transporter DcuC n=1 Tax=Oleispirillum naphthae TaxID=2838853 RepID=UPI00308226C4
MFGIILTVAAVVAVSWFVVKNHYPQIVLLVAGLALLALASAAGTPPLDAKHTTHFLGFDVVQVMSNLMSSRLAGLGLNIMAIGGFATYMERIGASKALVKLCVKPLQAIRSPYLLLALTYVVGQFIALFINSAVGLGLLLMASVYPLLIALGVTRVAAASVIATTCCLDLGPSSSNAMRAAELVKTDVVSYFIHGQIPVALCTVAVVAAMHFFMQRWFDKRDIASGRCTAQDTTPEDLSKAMEGAGPVHYAILPMLPLVLLIVFSPMVYAGVKLSLVTAIFVSLVAALLTDLLTRRALRDVLDATKAIFEGMGKVFISTVSLIICAETFATGLTKIGGINTMLHAAAGLEGAGLPVMLTVMMGIMILASVVTGSGNAAFFAFSPLLPDAAASVGVPLLPLVVPVQLAAGLARTMSPIVGVVIAVSGISGVTPFDIVRRTTPVMIAGLIMTVVSSLVFL